MYSFSFEPPTSWNWQYREVRGSIVREKFQVPPDLVAPFTRKVVARAVKPLSFTNADGAPSVAVVDWMLHGGISGDRPELIYGDCFASFISAS